jgi:hypothetical protein
VIVVGVAADLELHAVGVAKEQRPLVAEPLDLADVGPSSTSRSRTLSSVERESTARP